MSMGFLSRFSLSNCFPLIGPETLSETETQFERSLSAVLDGLKEGDVVTYGEVAIEAGITKEFLEETKHDDK